MYNLYDKIKGAKNFSLLELIKSDTAMRRNIGNLPKDEWAWNNLMDLAVNCLQPIRDEFGPIKVTSGYRSPELCLVIGSFIYSNHVYGLAADIEPFHNNIQLIDILNWIYNNLEYKELIAEHFPGGWIHIAYQKNNNKKILKLKDMKHDYKIVDIDYINKIYK